MTTTKREVTTYPTWEAWLDHVQKDPKNAGATNQSVENQATERWDKGLGFKGAHRLAREGYQEPLERVERLATAVEAQIDLSLFQTDFVAVRDVAGSEVDVALYLEGEPECMIEAVPLKVSRHGRAVRLVVPITASANVDADRFERRGAAIVALADLLARAQHPVEIWVAMPIGSSDQGYGAKKGNKAAFCDLIRIQAADDPLDVGRLLFAIAHPGCFRRLGFRSLEQSKVGSWIGSFGYGYGTVQEVHPDDLPDQVENTFVLPVLDYKDSWDEKFAHEWIQGILDQVFG